ncbi:MAG TPA: hypothetical protein VG452_13610 [Egibacteraceae bacterium]|nr:hypothetical protein [Egibacteraceae bacterium]
MFFDGQPTAHTWGVFLHGDLVLASDINSGLWVLRLEGLAGTPSP